MTRRRRQFNHDIPRLRRSVQQRTAQVQAVALQAMTQVVATAGQVAMALEEIHSAMGVIEADLAALRHMDPGVPASLDAVLGPDTVATLRRVERFVDAAAEARPPLALVRCDDRQAPTTTTTSPA